MDFIFAKKAPRWSCDERGEEGASHADEGGNICCIKTRQENLYCCGIGFCSLTNKPTLLKSSNDNIYTSRETIVVRQIASDNGGLDFISPSRFMF